MDIKYPIENEYMKYVLQINGFRSPRPRVRSSRLVGSDQGGTTFILVLEPRFRRFYELILHYVCHALHLHIKG